MVGWIRMPCDGLLIPLAQRTTRGDLSRIEDSMMPVNLMGRCLRKKSPDPPASIYACPNWLQLTWIQRRIPSGLIAITPKYSFKGPCGPRYWYQVPTRPLSGAEEHIGDPVEPTTADFSIQVFSDYIPFLANTNFSRKKRRQITWNPLPPS